MTFLDKVGDMSENDITDYSLNRTGRTGVALLIAGIYMMMLGANLMCPDRSSKTDVPEAYDGNIWEYYTWKRGNMLFVSFLLIMLMVAIIQFSFSEIFSIWLWYMIALFKLVQVILEYIAGKAVFENLLLCPISICIGITQNLVTFGANDFLDFLQSYFIEMAMMIIERTYYSKLVLMLTTYLEYVYHKLLRWFKKFISGFDIEEEEELARKRQQQLLGGVGEEKDAKEGEGIEDDINDEQDSLFSEVVYFTESDEGSWEDQSLEVIDDQEIDLERERKKRLNMLHTVNIEVLLILFPIR